MGFRCAIVPPGSGGLPGSSDGPATMRAGASPLTDVREAPDLRSAVATALGQQSGGH
jgi:hypothetical protein